MSTRIMNIDRETPVMFPASVQELLPENHLARFIVEAVSEIDTGAFKVNTRGTTDERLGIEVCVRAACG